MVQVQGVVASLYPSGANAQYEIAMINAASHIFSGTVIEPSDTPSVVNEGNVLSIDWLEEAPVPVPIKRMPAAQSAADGVSLKQCINKFTEREVLGENDMYYCSACKEHKQAEKKFDLWSAPECLIVHFKRFSQHRYGNSDFGRLERLDTAVEFPTELDMAPWLLSPDASGTVYDLYGVSNHMGGMGGGHYTAFCKTGDGSVADREWYKFDDSRTSVSSPSEISGKAAYVLFYMRRP